MLSISSRTTASLCLSSGCNRRRRPAEGGIVERPFGTFNSEFFSTLPGYTTSRAQPHMSQIKADACLTLKQLDSLLTRHIVDNYNQHHDGTGLSTTGSQRCLCQARREITNQSVLSEIRDRLEFVDELMSGCPSSSPQPSAIANDWVAVASL